MPRTLAPGPWEDDDLYLRVVSALAHEWLGPEDAAAYDELADSPEPDPSGEVPKPGSGARSKDP